jgi:hypothetical protein
MFFLFFSFSPHFHGVPPSPLFSSLTEGEEGGAKWPNSIAPSSKDNLLYIYYHHITIQIKQLLQLPVFIRFVRVPILYWVNLVPATTIILTFYKLLLRIWIIVPGPDAQYTFRPDPLRI